MADHVTTPTCAIEKLREIAAFLTPNGELGQSIRFAVSLIDENARLRDDLASKQPSVPELRAQLERVQALPGEWRDESAEMLELAKDQDSLVSKVAYEREASDSQRRADELDAALKGSKIELAPLDKETA